MPEEEHVPEEVHGDVFAPGQIVGGYRIVRKLGKGGMAEVYEVESVKTGSPYALKVFVCEQANAIFLKKRFLAEGRLLVKLHHPRIVRVYDFDFEGEDRPYFVMDIVLDAEGRSRTLRDIVETGEYGEDRIAGWYEDLSEALSYIHGKGIVHRDISLENVLVGPDGRAVISDFGVSKIVDRDLRTELNISMVTTISDGKLIMGKAYYIAPEVKAGKEETAASDLYSLGVLVFYMLNKLWYTPGGKMTDSLAVFDEQWLGILTALLAENPADRKCLPWNRRLADETDGEHDSGTPAEPGNTPAEPGDRTRRWRIASGILLAAAITLAAVLAIVVTRPVDDGARHPGAQHSKEGDARAHVKANPNVYCQLPLAVKEEKEFNLVRPLVLGEVAQEIKKEREDIGEYLYSRALEFDAGKVDGESLRKAIRLLTFQAAFLMYLHREDFASAAYVLRNIREEHKGLSDDLLRGIPNMPKLLPNKDKVDAFMKEWRAMGDQGRRERDMSRKKNQSRPRKGRKKGDSGKSPSKGRN